MVKLFIKYLSILCIPLSSVSGSGQQVVSASYSNVSYQQVKNQKKIKNTDTQQNNFALISSSFAFNNKKKFLFEYDGKFEEDDKDNVIPQKENAENLYNLSSFFTNNYTKLLFFRNPQILHFSKNFLHIPCNKLFIVFQVFRI